MNTNTRAIEVIRGARDILSDSVHWTKGRQYVKEDLVDKYCLLGALRHAAGLNYAYYAYQDFDMSCYDSDAAREAVNLLAPLLPVVGDSTYRFPWVTVFNDQPGTTHQDVLNVLDKALAEAGEMLR
jgi:hypothetical protein